MRYEIDFRYENGASFTVEAYATKTHTASESLADAMNHFLKNGVTCTSIRNLPDGNDMRKYYAFVKRLAYGNRIKPITIDEAASMILAWHDFDSIEPPAGFTAEIYAKIWNELCNASNEQ